MVFPDRKASLIISAPADIEFDKESPTFMVVSIIL
jgi:hypothetical protein